MAEAAGMPPFKSTMDVDLLEFYEHFSEMEKTYSNPTPMQREMIKYFNSLEKRIDSTLEITDYMIKYPVKIILMKKVSNIKTYTFAFFIEIIIMTFLKYYSGI
jgi:hypothetical protein